MGRNNTTCRWVIHRSVVLVRFWQCSRIRMISILYASSSANMKPTRVDGHAWCARAHFEKSHKARSRKNVKTDDAHFLEDCSRSCRTLSPRSLAPASTPPHPTTLWLDGDYFGGLDRNLEFFRFRGSRGDPLPVASTVAPIDDQVDSDKNEENFNFTVVATDTGLCPLG